MSQQLKRKKSKTESKSKLIHYKYSKSKHKLTVAKEDRPLKTWTKMEIAEWLLLNWYNENTSKHNSKLLLYVNKIKREKKFNGKNIEKLNQRCINLLAQRQLGLKKGGNDYKVFTQKINELQTKYTYKNKKRVKPVQSCPLKLSHIKITRKPKTNWKTQTKRKIKRRRRRTTPHTLHFSCTSPAVSDVDVITSKTHSGVTNDELIKLISYGQCDEIDTDYDTEYIISYPHNNECESPYDYNYSSISPYNNIDIGHQHDKTMVIPSIFSLNISDDLDDQKNHLGHGSASTPLDICLSPMTDNENIMCYPMTDEDSDEELINSKEANKDIKNMVNNINNSIRKQQA